MVAESPCITARYKKATSSPSAWSQEVSAFCTFCDPAAAVFSPRLDGELVVGVAHLA